MKNQEEVIDKKFLYKENNQLRQQLKETRQLLTLHKQAVLRLSNPHIQGCDAVHVLLDLLNLSQSTSKIDMLNEKIWGLLSQQMVLQKIVEEADSNEKETYHILAEEYNRVKKDNDKLQSQLHKFYEKIGQVDYLSGLVTKYKQIISPTEQATAFKNQQQKLLEYICMQKESIRKVTEQKNKLLKINILMKESMEKHKDDVRNMTMILNSPEMLMNWSIAQKEDCPIGLQGVNILDELNDQQDINKSSPGLAGSYSERSQTKSTNLSVIMDRSAMNSSMLHNTSAAKGANSTINFIKMQRKIIKQQSDQLAESDDQQSSDQYECIQINVLFPDKVEKIKKDKEITKIPYLNMIKIRQLMAKRDQKMRKGVEADNRHVNPTDKIIKLQTQLDITRKDLTSQSLKFRNMSEELKSSLRLIEELQSRNQVLINSYQRLEANYKNMYKDYQFTKMVALRVEKALGKGDIRHHLIEDINSTQNFDEKIKSTETVLKKIFGRKVAPISSRSLGS